MSSINKFQNAYIYFHPELSLALCRKRPPNSAKLLKDGESIEELFNNIIAEFMRNFGQNMDPCLTASRSKTLQVDQETKPLKSPSLGDDILGA